MCVARFRRAIGLVPNRLRTYVVVIRRRLPATCSQIAQEFLCFALIVFSRHNGSHPGRLRSFGWSANVYLYMCFLKLGVIKDSRYLFAGTQLQPGRTYGVLFHYVI